MKKPLHQKNPLILEAKSKSKRLHSMLKSRIPAISLGECLNYYSRMEGAGDWNALSALLKQTILIEDVCAKKDILQDKTSIMSEAKNKAKRLHSMLESRIPAISLDECLDYYSRMQGALDWNMLSEHLEKGLTQAEFVIKGDLKTMWDENNKTITEGGMPVVQLDPNEVQKLFENAVDPSDALIGLYRMVFPQWDSIKSIDRWPAINKTTFDKISRLFLKLAEERCLEGGTKYAPVNAAFYWMSKGFSSVCQRSEELGDWEVDTSVCSIELEDINK